jgi:hypothetical protein
MRVRGTTSFVIGLALLLAPLAGCDVVKVRVRLAKFSAGNVDGVWLWRYSAAQRSYQRLCRIKISDPLRRDGRELVSYVQSCADDRPQAPVWQAVVARLAADPDTVELSLLYRRWGEQAPFKATAYNGAGESALSRSTLQL